MRLSDRISTSNAAQRDETAGTLLVHQTRSTADMSADDPMWRLRQRISSALYERLGARLFDPSLDQAQLTALVSAEVSSLVAESGAPLNPQERQRFVREILGDVMGLGPLEEYLADTAVTEVMVNSTDPIYIERSGRIERTGSRFVTEDHLRRVIERIVASVGRRIDESSPMVDARLADGSRVNAIIPPLSVDGPALTIRKFSNDKLGMDDLVRIGTLTPAVAELLAATVQGAITVMVSGGTGTGKTTLLNALSSFIPDDERIITIEDAVELQLRQDHVVRLEARPPNVEGRGEVTIRDLVRNALRMRPDRIIVGEVRGPETLDMLQAINTGHDGSLTTVHANSPRDALSRVETMVMMAGFDLPLRAIRDQMASGFDLIVQLSRFRDGSRRVTQVTEVVGMEGDVITLSDLYTYDHGAGETGVLRATGLRPAFADRLLTQGIPLPDGIAGDPAARPGEAWTTARRRVR